MPTQRTDNKKLPTPTPIELPALSAPPGIVIPLASVPFTRAYAVPLITA
jgi:hypothetical protein